MSLLEDLFVLPDSLLQSEARTITKKLFCNKIYLRAIIEISNICHKNCFYCGLRFANNFINRYQMTEDEVISVAYKAFKRGYKSIVLQSGERQDDQFIEYVDRIIRKLKSISDGNISIVLSLGEQDVNVYKLWHNSGADRYLLRIETSNKQLYSRLHPQDTSHDFETRLSCLRHLYNLGYQLGTGTLIGVEGQTFEDLINDVLFFKNLDIDMIGMGPYIPQVNTPMINSFRSYNPVKALSWTFRMIAVCRIFLRDVNIASTTAIDAIEIGARVKAFEWGANVLMPDVTPDKYRKQYLIYSEKEKISAQESLVSLADRLAWNDSGDPLHYSRRCGINKKIY